MSLSPDGRAVGSNIASANADISTTDLSTGERRRLTFDATTEENPVYSPDGRRAVYQSWSRAVNTASWPRRSRGAAEAKPPCWAPGISVNGFVVMAGGQRFIYPVPNPDAAVGEIQEVLNWAAHVRARTAGQ